MSSGTNKADPPPRLAQPAASSSSQTLSKPPDPVSLKSPTVPNKSVQFPNSKGASEEAKATAETSKEFICNIYSKELTGEGLLISTPEYLCFRPLDGSAKGVNIPWNSVLLLTLTSPKEFDVVTKVSTYTFYRVNDVDERFRELQTIWCSALNAGHNEGESLHCLRNEDLERLLAHFRVLDTQHKGELTRDDFVRPLLPLYETATLPNAIFRAFDDDKSGILRLGEWLDGMRTLTVGSAKDKLEFIFRIFDEKGDGLLSLRSFETIIRNLASITSFKLPQDEAGYTTFCSRLFRTFPISPEGNITVKEFAAGMPNVNLEEICGLTNFDLHVNKYGPPPKKHGVPLGFGDPQWPLITAILIGLKRCGLMRQCNPPDRVNALQQIDSFRRNSFIGIDRQVKIMGAIQSTFISPINNKLLAPISQSLQQDIFKPISQAISPLTNNVLNPIKKDMVNTFKGGLESKDVRRTITFKGIGDQIVNFTEFHHALYIEIRRQYGFDEDAYQHSLGLDRLAAGLVLGNLESPRRLSSSGRSASFFFLTHDTQLILKTLPRKEAQTLLQMSQNYHDYLLSHPNTLLTVYLGLYEVEMKETRVLFVTMLNVFPRGAQITLQYDLKGSTAGRTVAPQSRRNNVALKDLDFQSLKKALLLEEVTQKALFEQIRDDAEFLQSEGLNDYSFLLGIAQNAPPKIPTCPASRDFYKGIPALDSKEVYFCGIIDILTAYEGAKVIEHAAKSLYQTNFSCIPPFDYAKRFVDFLESILLTKHEQRLYLAATQTWASFASVSTATGRPIPPSIMDAIHAAAARAPSTLERIGAITNDGESHAAPFVEADHYSDGDSQVSEILTPDELTGSQITRDAAGCPELSLSLPPEEKPALSSPQSSREREREDSQSSFAPPPPPFVHSNPSSPSTSNTAKADPRSPNSKTTDLGSPNTRKSSSSVTSPTTKKSETTTKLTSPQGSPPHSQTNSFSSERGGGYSCSQTTSASSVPATTSASSSSSTTSTAATTTDGSPTSKPKSSQNLDVNPKEGEKKEPVSPRRLVYV